MNLIEYYRKNIYPLEKKYNRICALYNFLPCQYFHNKKTLYNNMLIMHYKMLKANDLQTLAKYFNVYFNLK